MIPAEKSLLRELLVKVALPRENGGEGGWIPSECLTQFHKLTVTPYYELVIHRVRDGADEFLVQDRHDRNWNGYHICGGMLKPRQPADPVGITQAILDREFEGLGLKVTSVRIVAPYKWPEHPWCNPSVDILLVEVKGDIPEDNGRLWVTSATMPDNMLVNHGMYIRQCEQFLRHGPLVFTPERPYGI